MGNMAFVLESAAKHYSNNEWVCNKVPDAAIQNDMLYIEFIATLKTNLKKLLNYFNKHIVDEVSLPFFHHCHLEKNNKIYIFCSLIHKELMKLAEMALDLSAEFRQFATNKKCAESSRKIVTENSAKRKPGHFIWICHFYLKMHMCTFSDNTKTCHVYNSQGKLYSSNKVYSLLIELSSIFTYFHPLHAQSLINKHKCFS